MLAQRVLTAIVLLSAVGASLWLGHRAFSILAVVFIAVGLYEWLHLAGYPKGVFSSLAAALFGALLLAIDHYGVSVAGSLSVVVGAMMLWMAIAVLLWRIQKGQTMVLPRSFSALLGVWLLGAAWLGLMALSRQGVPTLLSALAIVWVADSAAYFSGRAWGRRQLASRLSPGKTWVGVLGGGAAVIGVSSLAAWVLPSVPLWATQHFERFAYPVVIGLLVVLVVLSIVGDLFESWLKRQAGVKDSGALLPGHGGVLDRIDALLPVLPAIWLIDVLWS